MRALLLRPDPEWLEERRRLGQDRFDEVWDGVLHVVPSPTVEHQRVEGALERVLFPIVTSHGLEIFHNLDVLDREKGDQNYRQPDLAVVSANDLTGKRAIDGHAELVVEIRSPDDESYDKLPFYEKCRIPEYWIVDPITRAFEVFVLRRGTYTAAKPDANGAVYAPRFALHLSLVHGPKLRIAWADGNVDV
jgi:Uma2 family endonuclease